jgi:lauroyl/myristoyl acyltransferase
MTSTDRQSITAKDVYEVPRLAVQGVFSWLTPQAVWPLVAHRMGRINAAMHPQRTVKDSVRIATALFGARPSNESWDLAAELWANRYEERFQYMRAWRPGGWNPEIRILGSEHVKDALARGRGIIFWGSNFSFNDLVTKMAWHRLGLRVRHFSRPTHGFSETEFGVRYLNAVRRGIEDNYLDARLMTEEKDTREVLERLRQHLTENGSVSFTVGERGRRRAAAKFMHGTIELATGPLFMAHSVGSTVLPVFTLRESPAKFETTVGAPLALDVRNNGEPDFSAAVQDYADRLVPYVRRDPGQWKGWRFVRTPESPS